MIKIKTCHISVVTGVIVIFGLLTISPGAQAAQKDCQVLSLNTFVQASSSLKPDNHYVGLVATVRNRTKLAKEFRAHYQILNMTDKTVEGTFTVSGVIPARTTLPLPSVFAEEIPIGANLKLKRSDDYVWECSTTKKKTFYADVVWPDPSAECGPDQYYAGERGVAGCPKISVTNNTTKNLKLDASTIVWFDSTNKIVWTSKRNYYSETDLPAGFSQALPYFGPGIPGEAVRAEGWLTTN